MTPNFNDSSYLSQNAFCCKMHPMSDYKAIPNYFTPKFNIYKYLRVIHTIVTQLPIIQKINFALYFNKYSVLHASFQLKQAVNRCMNASYHNVRYILLFLTHPLKKNLFQLKNKHLTAVLTQKHWFECMTSSNWSHYYRSLHWVIICNQCDDCQLELKQVQKM